VAKHVVNGRAAVTWLVEASKQQWSGVVTVPVPEGIPDSRTEEQGSSSEAPEDTIREALDLIIARGSWPTDDLTRLRYLALVALDALLARVKQADEREAWWEIRDAEAAKEIARFQHIIDCADTPLMRDVLADKLAAEREVADSRRSLRDLEAVCATQKEALEADGALEAAERIIARNEWREVDETLYGKDPETDEVVPIGTHKRRVRALPSREDSMRVASALLAALRVGELDSRSAEPPDPPCPGCGMTAQVERSRSEPGKWMCHGCAQTFETDREPPEAEA
jgi:hypothetical protein